MLQTFLTRGAGRHVLVLINDNFADGRDVSWLWDVGFEDLAAQGHQIIASGIRGTDLALRLKYAGMTATVEDDLERALARLIDATPVGGTAYVLPTYTAMLDVRRLLGRRQDLRGMWE